jgi:hypothetical protein
MYICPYEDCCKILRFDETRKLKNDFLVINSSGSLDYLVVNTLGSLGSLVLITPES